MMNLSFEPISLERQEDYLEILSRCPQIASDYSFLNLWSWPYITGPANQFWESGITWLETIKRYSVYYMITSAAWDLARSVGNFVFILLFGEPVLRALRRFKKKFSYTYDIPQSDLADKISQDKQE